MPREVEIWAMLVIKIRLCSCDSATMFSTTRGCQ
jgi:hypothetical protein